MEQRLTWDCETTQFDRNEKISAKMIKSKTSRDGKLQTSSRHWVPII